VSPAAPRPLVLGNFKMHLTAGRTAAYLRDLLPRLPRLEDRDIAVAPSFTALAAAAGVLAGSAVALAAQDVFWDEEGPYTGEIAPLMLVDLGVRHVIVGHSERRRHLGETDRMVARKAAAALRAGLHAVVCVGEEEAARRSGRAPEVVRAQLARALDETPDGSVARLAVAYEPVWAIGTGLAATPDDVAAMHAVIRAGLRARFGEQAAAARLLYGGSVTAANIDALMGAGDVQGVLVGGASLRADEFARIAAYAPRS
jgi:triosephosphate isomerase